MPTCSTPKPSCDAGVPRRSDRGHRHPPVGATRKCRPRGRVHDPLAREGIVGFAPDLVIHQLTDLPDHLDELFDYVARNNRIRTEGTRNLLAAAVAVGARLLAQSIAWVPPGSSAAVDDHERLVLNPGGIVVRYGQLYGPGTYYPDDLPAPPRIQIDDAAQRTMALLDAPSGVVVVTDENG